MSESRIDLRQQMFGDCAWYRELPTPIEGIPSAWYIAKDTDNEWPERLLGASFAFAREHGVLDHYRRRFAGIDSQ